MYEEYPDLIYEGLVIDISNCEILNESFNIKEKISQLFKKIKMFLSKIKQKFIDKLRSISTWMKNIGPRLKDKWVDLILESGKMMVQYYNINNVINFFSYDINDILSISTTLNDFIKVLDYTFEGFDKGENRLTRARDDRAYEFYQRDIQYIKDLYNDYKYLADKKSYKYFTGFGIYDYDSRGRINPNTKGENDMILTRKVLDLDIKLINFISKCGFDKKIDEINKIINDIESKYNEGIKKYASQFSSSINIINTDIRFLCSNVTKLLSGVMSIITETEQVCRSHIEKLNNEYSRKGNLINDKYMQKDKYNMEKEA